MSHRADVPQRIGRSRKRLAKSRLILIALPLIVTTAARNAREASPAMAGRTIYVSPSGADRNPGTKDRPIKTLSHAQALVRRLKGGGTGNITVFLKGGVYRLSRPWRFGPADSGAKGHTVTWTSTSLSSGSGATIAGSVRLRGWKPAGASGIWAAKVPAGLNTRQLYVNGQRATPAAGPLPVRLSKTTTGYRASSAALSHWRNPSSIDFVYTAQLGLMVEPICPVASIRGAIVTMAQPCWNNSNLRTRNLVGFGTLRAPTYAENAFELLRNPGQFYLDRQAHRMYYIPFAGQIMRTANVEAPVLQTLLSARGNSSRPIHDIVFSNLRFEYATWLQPGTGTGFSDMQQGYSITGSRGYATQGLCQTVPGGSCPYGNWTKEPAAVTLSYDRSIRFAGNAFIHLGAAGLNLDDGSQRDSVSGSVFTDISGNGLQIGSVDAPRATGVDQTTNVTVANNHLYGLPVEYHGGVAILAGYAAHTRIIHNQVDHVSYSGVSLGWGGWPDKKGMAATANYSHDNLVSENRIFDFMQVLSDGGGIYTQGITGSSNRNGQQVTGNVVHDQLAWGRALQSDDGATYVNYRANVLFNDNYDWGSNHIDYRYGDGRYDAQTVIGNYWQQGTPDSNRKRVVVSGNHLIAGPGDAPRGVMARAGLESGYTSLLGWAPPGETLPSPPQRVSVLYAFGHATYVSWRPSYGAGAPSAVSYTVVACDASRGFAPAGCARRPIRTVTISASAFNRQGYAIVQGLTPGSRYAFSVVARSRSGAGTPSIPSSVATVSGRRPRAPGACRNFDAVTVNGRVRLLWYGPASSPTNPVLDYTVSWAGGKHVITGLRPLIVSNSGGRVVDVVSGLKRGRSYTFTVSARDPSGSGPGVTTNGVKP